ncbi:MAG: hypothetical protein K1X67_20260 [Fimbriimonadaceae bacterium]|nr:hypothetical protein [Fimbriimonadaceae bacterium]
MNPLDEVSARKTPIWRFSCLPSRPPYGWGHPATLGALPGGASGVDHDHAVVLGRLLADATPQLGQDALVVPADEELEIGAEDVRLRRDRLDRLPGQPAEQPPDEGTGVSALLFAVEQRHMAIQEARDVVAAAAHVVRGGFGFVQERDGGAPVQ